VNLRNTLQRLLLPLAVAALPVVLLYSSMQTFRELDAQRSVYLRHRVSLLAARLENLSPGATPEAVREVLAENEPYLLDVLVISRGAAGDTAGLEPMWNGRELFRTGDPVRAPARTFRAYVPFHTGGGLHIARIDLDPAAADFLLVHARHNLVVAFLSGLALVLLSLFSVYAMRRAAKLQVRQIQMEHLAHIGKLAAAMAHEIRNPLGTIKGFVQLAGERTDPATREMLRPAVAEAERLERLVSDLLAYGRPPAPVLTTVDWREIAARISAHARQSIAGRPISLAVSETDAQWRSDPALLEQILLNLVRNAIEAIPPATPGEVRVELDPNADGLTISVLDTGTGFLPDTAGRLFEPFFTTKASGTGLGLAVSRGLVRALGGELKLQRRTTGGTAAVIRFAKIAVARGALA